MTKKLSERLLSALTEEELEFVCCAYLGAVEDNFDSDEDEQNAVEIANKIFKCLEQMHSGGEK